MIRAQNQHREDDLRTTILFLVTLAALSGCAQPKIWNHQHGDQSKFYADKLACEQTATSMMPDATHPAPVQAPVVAPNAYETNCVSNRYSVNCTTSANQSAQLVADMAAQGANAGAQAGYAISLAVTKMNRERVFDECMKSKGYTEQSAPVTSTEVNDSVASCKTHSDCEGDLLCGYDGTSKRCVMPILGKKYQKKPGAPCVEHDDCVFGGGFMCIENVCKTPW